VGTVTSGTSPAVTNSGTTSAAVFDFTLQKGDKGDKGDTGEQGPQGEPGTVTAVAGSAVSTFSGTGSATVFAPLNGYNGTDVGAYLVSVGGIDQRPTTDWTISSANGGTITFASAPPNGAPIVVRAFVGTGTTNGNATLLQGRAMANTAPTSGQAVVWDSTLSTWKPGAVSIAGGTLYDENTIYKDGDIVSCHFLNPPFTYGVFVCTVSKCQESQGFPITGKVQGISPPTSFPMVPDPYWGPITFNNIAESKINEIITWANSMGANISSL
jgi:hypothetical protein